MRILVAGGAGFIGSHVCETLLDRGHNVTCLDSLATGRRANIEELEHDERFAFVEADVVEAPALQCDMVLHLASPASPVYYRAEPLDTMMANSAGTLRLLQLAEANAARFVFASTSEVYGEPLEHPQRESYWGNVNPVGERSCYDESKRFGETLTYEFARRGVNASIVRIFNTYGPRMDAADGRVIPAFIDAALHGRSFPVQGTGEQTRSFCYVADLVDVLLRVAFAEDIAGEVFNIGMPGEVTMLELAEMIAHIAQCDATYDFLPAAKDDPTRRCPDISRVQARLGWQPATKLLDGLRSTFEYFESRSDVRARTDVAVP